MKKSLIFLFSFLSIFSLSQEYHFDYKCYENETQLKGSYKGQKRTTLVYFNSQNKSFIAYDYSFSGEIKRRFFLRDNYRGKLSSYSINKKSEFLSLKFLEVSTLNKYRDEIEVENIEVENIIKNVFIIKASTIDKKNSTLELIIKVEKSNFPMPEIRFMDLTDNIHSKIYKALLLHLDSPNYRIVDVVTDYKNGVIMYDDFSNCEKINVKFLAGPPPPKKKSNILN
ncbi:hypothetical protein OMO38_13310 [Chryseobacterium sp. 09-1422]|uniref:DUF3108 domain-containing protein n=1 Tax=Chryseobacterium kimseyorum TaxID=2984028 RepID=A0ABT3I0C7_9FLAO|nr:hypothetical protein [Chryseobacterium kimseyorum]MCW3169501.1 hypothetical protein [Chryseobacterium kimseyorum]